MNRNLRHVLAVGFTATVLTMPLLACDKIAASIDCNAICSNLKDCYDSDLDESDCRDSCSDKVEDDDALRADANDCEDCLGDNDTCSEAKDRCGICAGVRESFQSAL